MFRWTRHGCIYIIAAEYPVLLPGYAWMDPVFSFTDQTLYHNIQSGYCSLYTLAESHRIFCLTINFWFYQIFAKLHNELSSEDANFATSLSFQAI